MTNIIYRFVMKDGREERIEVHLDGVALEILDPLPDDLPTWTRINFYQCPHCPLDVNTHPHCLVAGRLVEMIEPMRHLLSYEEIVVDVELPQRRVSRITSAQKGVSSLMGLIMATSGCPHLHFLKPMAHFHLPLASVQETVYRTVSSYLLAQYFLHKAGKKADLELAGLKEIYRNIKIINETMAKRLRSVSEKDMPINSLVILDIFAEAVPFAIDESLEELRPLFFPYFEKHSETG